MNKRTKSPVLQPAPRSRSRTIALAIGAVVFAAFASLVWYISRSTSPPTISATSAPRSQAAPAAEPSTDAPVAAAPPVLASATAQDETEMAAVPRMSISELEKLRAEGGVTVIDVRDVDDYVTGHIPGALQIPLAYIQGEIPWLHREHPVVTVCT